MIHINYGYGQGKTTAALGLGMRAYGSGKSVLLVQFLKDNKSSELNALAFDIVKAPDSLPFNPDSSYQPWVDCTLKQIKESDCDIIILDEFLDVIGGFVTETQAAELINSLSDKEILITGHKEIESIFNMADYITYFEKKKHPYDSGVKARKGIEY